VSSYSLQIDPTQNVWQKIKSKIDITNFNIRPKNILKFEGYTFVRVYESEYISVDTNTTYLFLATMIFICTV